MRGIALYRFSVEALSRNLWNRFRAVTGGPAYLLVGECVAARFGSCTLELPSGTKSEVSGAGVVGVRYFVRDGKLDGEAPELALLEMEL